MPRGNFRNSSKAAIPGIKPGPTVQMDGIQVKALRGHFDFPAGVYPPDDRPRKEVDDGERDP